MASFALPDLLRLMPDMNASDLHIRAEEPPVMRVNGKLGRLTDFPVMTADDTRELMTAIMTPSQEERFEETRVLDMAYEMEGVARFRVNVFHQQHAVGAVMRMIPIKIKSVEELGLPPILKEFAMLPRGLVLVTGPTGSGKSTTLAAMIHHINATRAAHIITIEDPIEFVHEDVKCVIEQREVGQDTHTFNDALRHVMRQTPDVILVGEMRDLETIQLAITAAETGHLVFGTLHTTDAMQTVDRAVDVFPPAQQQQIRMQLSVTLAAVVCQALLPIKDRAGRVPSFEIMKGSPAIRAVIREGKTHMLYNLIQSGAEEGMIVLDQYLAEMVRREEIAYEAALSKSSYPGEFAKRCGEFAVLPEDEEAPLVLGHADAPPQEAPGGYVHGQAQSGQQ
ncbi:MAG: type IV pilus twitching motility protein PilT [Armatimonadia bacterium]